MKKNLLTAVLIDDEAHCLNTLRWNLSTFFPEINIVGEAMNGNDGFKIINEINPDVIFLDVEMPGMNGFEMLNKFDKINFKVIFITPLAASSPYLATNLAFTSSLPDLLTLILSIVLGSIVFTLKFLA